MQIVYNLGIYLYIFAAFIFSLINPKAKLLVKGRLGLLKKIKLALKEPHKPLIWIHCASLGEFEQGRPIIENIREKYQDFDIFLTFFSPSGFEIRKNYKEAKFVFYLPFDTPSNAKKLIQIVSPAKAIFIKYEFWFNYLSQLNEKRVPLYLASAIFRQNQHFFKPMIGQWFVKMLKLFDFIFVQDSDSQLILESIGITNALKVGDTRFDRVAQIASAAIEIPKIESFSKNSDLLVAGSTWPSDENIILTYLSNNNTPLKVIIAPHEIDEYRIKGIESNFQRFHTVRFSTYEPGKDDQEMVLIIDNIGMLSSIYRYGQIAYIGGGFDKGIHNTLEAAVYGIPVLFGPNHLKFKEAIQLKMTGAAFSFKSPDEFNQIITSLLNNQTNRKKIGEKAALMVSSSKGATQLILNKIFA